MKSALNWKGWLAIIMLLGAVSVAYLAYPRFEDIAPRINAPEAIAIGVEGANIDLELMDGETGLRNIQVRLVHGGGGQVVFEQDYAGGVLDGLPSTATQLLSIPLDPHALKLADGSARLIVTVRDWSWHNSGDGNRSEVGVALTVDTKAPQLKPTAGLTYIYRGGAAAATYEVSEATLQDGVVVGDRFYAGYPAPGSKPNDGKRIAFFAVEVHAPANPQITLQATDLSGNTTTTNLRVKVFERKFPEERLSLSQRFFDGVIPPLAKKVDVSEPDNVKAFQRINREVRAANEVRIQELVAASDPVRHWSQAFVQLPGSKVMSRFAEQRRYFTGKEEISQATHYGFDLASRAAADVVAANSGRVVFAEDLGIYGNCVLVDHGLGIISLYAHLTDFAVKPGERVERRQTLGRTGATGLAGGDHLHFAILIGGSYVDPLEWWDARWIQSHVEVKIGALGL